MTQLCPAKSSHHRSQGAIGWRCSSERSHYTPIGELPLKARRPIGGLRSSLDSQILVPDLDWLPDVMRASEIHEAMYYRWPKVRGFGCLGSALAPLQSLPGLGRRLLSPHGVHLAHRQPSTFMMTT